MLTHEQIQAAADRIAAVLHPKKIILFGSYARGDATEHSDLDLMVIDPSTVKSEYEAMTIGQHAVGSMDIGVDVLVYDQDTFERRAAWRSSPIHWALTEGRVLYEENQVYEWIMLEKIAENDLKVFRFLIASEEMPLASACFHGQQAVEKYMKAVLSKRKVVFPFTHDLGKLHALLAEEGLMLPFSAESLEKLNPFAVKQRYDMPPEVHLARPEAKEIVEITVDWCKKQLHD